MKKGKLFVVSGPSGAGKSTVTKKVRENLGIPLSISATTRKPRKQEVNSKDYYFLSEKEFKEKISNNEFLEHALVHGNYYGTLKSEVENKLKDGKDIILEIDVQGGIQIKKLLEDTVLIFFKPPSMEELELRLKNRDSDTKETIDIRMKNAKKELSYEKQYTYLIINDSIENSVKALESIILNEGTSVCEF